MLDEGSNDNTVKLVVTSRDLLQKSWNSYASGMFPRKRDPVPWSAASSRKARVRSAHCRRLTVDDRWIHALRSTIHDPWSWSMGGIHVWEMRSWWSPVVLAGDHFSGINKVLRYRSLLASRSDSSKVRRSPSRTGPFTFLMICRFCSPKNSTFTWVHCPCEPVRPRTLITRAKTTGLSILIVSHTWIVTRTRYLAQMEEKWERVVKLREFSARLPVGRYCPLWFNLWIVDQTNWL